MRLAAQTLNMQIYGFPAINELFFPDTLKYHIHAIKKKLAEAGGSENLIKNVRGVGYMVVDE